MTNLLIDEKRWLENFHLSGMHSKIPIIYSMPSDMVIDENVTMNGITYCSKFKESEKRERHFYEYASGNYT